MLDVRVLKETYSFKIFVEGIMKMENNSTLKIGITFSDSFNF